MLENIQFISRVEQDISLFRFAHCWRYPNKFHISQKPCIILYIIIYGLRRRLIFTLPTLHL